MDQADARRAGLSNIGEAARQSGVSARMIRHYESRRLLKKPRRTVSGYRVYDERDVHTLRFIRRARALGFSIREIQRLLALWQDRRRASAEVRRVAQGHIAALEARILELQGMRRTLEELVRNCHGDARPECPILDDLAGSRH
ncbi:MAG TPA: Cu(I)-responsive transcriptional regulator [Vicinamibacterales bacterium]|nr:Cu(I)-responsive transcriptional regulator [Vicinamibacterales bacterium]